MVQITVAGTGCFLGKVILLALNTENKTSVEIRLEEEGNSDILNILKTSLDINDYDEILINKDILLKDIYKDFKSEGYDTQYSTNMKKLRDIADLLFVKQLLFDLKVSKDLTLLDCNYKELREKLIDEVSLNPYLARYIRKSSLKDKSVSKLLRLIDRLTTEFPNLYDSLIYCN